MELDIIRKIVAQITNIDPDAINEDTVLYGDNIYRGSRS